MNGASAAATENTNLPVPTNGQAVEKSSYDLAVEAVVAGVKIPNGLYGRLTQAQKAQIRQKRLECAGQESARFLSGEMVANGWKLENRQVSTMKSGDQKLELVVYKRQVAPTAVVTVADASKLSDDDLLAELARRDAAKKAAGNN